MRIRREVCSSVSRRLGGKPAVVEPPVAQLNRARDFVAGDPLAALGDQLLRGDLASVLDNDYDVHGLAPARVGHPEHRRLAHRLVFGQRRLDLDRIDVFAAADDHVLEPVDQVQIPILGRLVPLPVSAAERDQDVGFSRAAASTSWLPSRRLPMPASSSTVKITASMLRSRW
jgi:hypothetical protein